MCEFVSWVEYNDEIYFLQNKDLGTKEGELLLRPEVIDDLCGHGAIRSYYPELKNKGANKECVNFSSPANFPAEIVEGIKTGVLSRIGICLEVLTIKGRAEYEKIKQPAMAEYRKIEQSAWAEYRKIKQSARAEYEKIEQSAWAEYEKIEQPAMAECRKIEQPAMAGYRKIEQPAWAEYEKIEQSAIAEYEKIEQSAMAEYRKIKQSAFSKLVSQKKYRIKAWK